MRRSRVGTRDGGRGLRRFWSGAFAHLPWWAALALGVAAVALGATITAKPFSSLGVLVALVAVSFVVTGAAEWSSARGAVTRWAGAAWVIAGIAVAAWPGLTIRGLAVLTGIALVAGGGARLISAISGDTDERLIAGVSGLARVIFGVLALSWPDVTVLVVALLVGPAMVIFGLGQAAAALRRRGGAEADHGGWPAWLRMAGVSASLVVALGLLLVSSRIHGGSSSPDAFYDAPASLPAAAGTLLRSEGFTDGIPDGARAWRILYTTTRDDRTPAIASGLVLVSDDAPAGPRPVIAWAHGTTGFAPKCAPSLLRSPFQAGALPDLDQIIAKGWVLVATDYVGLGTSAPHPYLIGEPSARSVLDAVRAARGLGEVSMDPRTVVWGHSQGGGAALWTGGIAPDYAPDVSLVGVAALAPATELPAIFDVVKDSPVGKIMGSYVISAYAATYPDVAFDDYVRPEARVLARETAERCLSGPEALVSIGTALGEPYFSAAPSSGPLGARLEENVPRRPVRAPLMIAQGLTDALVLPSEQDRYVRERCRAGQRLQYRTYDGLDHVGVVLDPASRLLPDLVAWTEDRLAGVPQAPGCERVRR